MDFDFVIRNQTGSKIQFYREWKDFLLKKKEILKCTIEVLSEKATGV